MRHKGNEMYPYLEGMRHKGNEIVFTVPDDKVNHRACRHWISLHAKATPF